MKTYFILISITQKILMAVSVGILLVLPFSLSFFPETFNFNITTFLYASSYYFLFFVMTIRPLSDIITNTKWIRPLVILRKGTGVFSASIIISFILAKIIVDPINYFVSFSTSKYWSFNNYLLFAHLADISAFLLLITSNRLSKHILGKWWKIVQKLSYVYFFGSSIYLYLSFGDTKMLYSMLIITLITLMAFIKNKIKRKKKVNNVVEGTLNLQASSKKLI